MLAQCLLFKLKANVEFVHALKLIQRNTKLITFSQQ